MKKLLIMFGVLSLMLPCVAMASTVDGIPIDKVDYLAVAGPDGVWREEIDKNGWQIGWALDDHTWIKLPNEQAQVWKLAWIMMVFTDVPPKAPSIEMEGYYESGPNQTAGFGNPQTGDNAIIWHWRLFPQPLEDNWFFRDGVDPLKLPGLGKIVVATWCIPLPASVWSGMGLMAGLFGVAGWRRRA